MSYAAAAAPHAGQNQSTEEKRAAPVAEVEIAESVESRSLIDVDSESVRTVPSNFKEQDIQTETQINRLEQDAKSSKEKAKEEAKQAAAKSKKEAKKVKSSLEANSENPVFVGNAIAITVLSGALGFGAYKKYASGELTCKVIAAWTGVVGLFAGADYYLSSYLFKNKYPKK
ncbi:hypothetical protein BJ878DRAFT_414325 [Calycina marina]|uniref:Mitochondrial outer membrane protein OM14 C-terminal domain-containing protein n=1 Tax=Calycina marina TaxID=1763456 RepID=A0A9P7Z995_9HELO|nr:hypothetical protein BJ878DRAFT_414325 [Calycina marina]